MSWTIDGKRVLVTGGSSGIGHATARELATRGARVTITARTAERAERNAEDLALTTGAEVDGFALDLGSMASVRSFADRFRSEVIGDGGLDVLVNNAGTIARRRTLTEDGFETTFAVGHLGPFLLTRLLLGPMTVHPESRVINVSSEVHRSASGGLDFDDLQMERGFSPAKAYAAAKLANILFTVELDRRVGDRGVVARALHPGVVATSFGKGGDGPWWMGLGMTLLKPLLKTPREGAETSVLLATADTDALGDAIYWSTGKPIDPAGPATDADAARRLWEESSRLVGLDP
jgi:retinol dehydrogenase-13